MLFTILVAFSAIFVAACAAFFSIKGLIVLFSGSALAIGIMASALELGKLVAASFLHSYWKKIGLLLRAYLCVAVVVLMCITSLGIFGFLTGAHQTHSTSVKTFETKIENLEAELKTTDEGINTSVARVKSLMDLRAIQEQRVKDAGNYKAPRDQAYKAIAEANEEIQQKENLISKEREKLLELNRTLAELKIAMNTTTDIGSFKFVASALNTDVDTAIRYFIYALIFVFDPLAVTLILALNKLIEIRHTEKTIREEKELKEILDRQPMEFPKYENKPVEFDTFKPEPPEEKAQIEPVSMTEEELKAIEEEKANRRKMAGNNNSIITI